MVDPLVLRCSCDDCESAVSPGAYLASLLDYVLKHVRNNGAKIDLAFLEARFHQPFSELPIDCEAMDKKVHEVRLAVEVLREYVGSRPLLEPARETSLSGAEADYRLAAYTRLLTLLGTSYEEIRRARSAATDERGSLAGRLGIDLTPPYPGMPRADELDHLFLDTMFTVNQPGALTEKAMERIFGLSDTVRNRLSEGVKYGDAQQQITSWSFDGAYLDRNIDAEGFIYLDIFKLAVDSYSVRAFSDAARSHVVATGERQTASGSIRLVPEQGSGLSGTIEIDYKADDTDISLALTPSMLVWRLHHLRTLWESEDWPTDVVGAAIAGRLPIIDPQVISLSDLRSARPGDAAYDLWLDRFNWMNSQRSALKAVLAPGASQLDVFETIISQALSLPGHPVTAADLDALKQAQVNGELIEARLSAWGLTAGAFAYLMPIRGLVKNGQTVIDLEWETVFDTLVFARKQLEFAAWRTEEQGRDLTLSPIYFQIGETSNAPEQATSLSVPLWLSTRDTRRNWSDILDARITQETTVSAGLESAVSSVEEMALPLLRDALIGAADMEGTMLVERAEWLTKRLLTDFRMSGLQVTTRVAQAIETLQELLFGLHTGQLGQETLLEFAPLKSICAAAQGNNRIDLFGRGEDDVLWHRIWDGGWSNWRSLGPLPGTGSFQPSDPAVVAGSDGRLDLMVRGSDRVMWHKHYEQGWSDWLRVQDDLELVGNLAVTQRAPDQMDVFALRIGDLQVMQRHYDGTDWTAWEATGASSSRTPAAASWAADRLDLFLGLDAPNLFKPLHRWWDGTAWQDEPLDQVFFSDPAAASWGINRLDVFQNYAGHLWQKTMDGTWQPWVDLDAGLAPNDPKMQAVPAVYAHTAGTLEVFALRSGSVEASVWRRRLAAGVWSAWEALPSDHLELDAPDFDSEWEWIGSYSTFRSATFVRLYPDNLLLPSLISRQTPAFRDLVDKTRPTKHLTPQEVCGLAQTYSGYLRDVTSLEIAASCQVQTQVNNNDPCKTAAPLSKNLLYMFGRATISGKVYWSAIDPTDRSGFAQSFWDEVPLAPKDGKAPAPKVINIIGALPWIDNDLNQHHIYLFLDVEELGVRKFKRIRFDLKKYGAGDVWEAEPSEIGEMPQYKGAVIDMIGLTILPVQSDSVAEAPRLAVHDHGNSWNVYIRALNATGDGWENTQGDDWIYYRIAPTYLATAFDLEPQEISQIEAALRVNKVNWLVYHWFNKNTSARHAYPVGPSGGSTYVCDYPSKFRGALPGYSSSDSSIFMFYEENGQTIYREITKSGGLGTAFIPTPSLTALARHSGSFRPMFFVTPRNKDGHSYAYSCEAVDGELLGSGKIDVIPVLGSVTDIPVGESMIALQVRRLSIKNVYQANEGASSSILAYLREAYRLVPQQLALNLQPSGEYVAALDWFMTVYDYRAPQGKRNIDYGLDIDAGLPETDVYHHPEDWLLDALNPHAIALTRRYAYTRFAISSIIRCLNDFADAEFTNDTDESLVRADLLYTTALELADAPELRQNLGVCEALIGAFEIQPGEVVPPDVAAALGEIADELTQGQLANSSEGLIALEKMKATVQSGKDWATILSELTVMKTTALAIAPTPINIGAGVVDRPASLAKVYSSLLTDAGIEKIAKLAGEIAVARASN